MHQLSDFHLSVTTTERVPADPTRFVGPLAHGILHRHDPPKGASSHTARFGTSSWGESPALHVAIQKHRSAATTREETAIALNAAAGNPSSALGVGARTPRRCTDGDVKHLRQSDLVAAATAALRPPPPSLDVPAAALISPTRPRARATTADCQPPYQSPHQSPPGLTSRMGLSPIASRTAALSPCHTPQRLQPQSPGGFGAAAAGTQVGPLTQHRWRAAAAAAACSPREGSEDALRRQTALTPSDRVPGITTAHMSPRNWL